MTLQDVAREAGCSPMAVSLALRDSPRVAADRREEIKAVAARLGYRPNPLVSAWVATRRRRNRSGAGTIALLSKFDEPMSQWRERREFYSDFYDALRERTEVLGFRLEEIPTHGPGRPDGARLTQILRARGIQGVLLMPGGGTDREFPAVDWQHFAVVVAGFHGREMPMHRTAANFHAAVGEVLVRLEARGYRRIGMYLPRSLDFDQSYLLSGRFLSWQQTQPESNRVPMLVGKVAVTIQEFQRWVRRERPDCVLSYHHHPGEWLQAMGLRVPDDIGYVVVPRWHPTTAAGIETNRRALAHTTVNLLVRELFLNHRGLPSAPEVVFIGGCWCEGDSIRPPEPGLGTVTEAGSVGSNVPTGPLRTKKKTPAESGDPRRGLE